jgi:Phage integrase, N-terminal SAM-like domain
VTHLRQIMLEELRRRNYAESTIHIYIHTVEHFSRHFHRSPDQLGPEQIRQYQAALFTRWKLAPNTVTQRLAALRFFYVQVLKRGWSVAETPYPKQGSALAAGAEPGRSGASDRRGSSLSSHSAADPLCHRRTSRRGGAP